MQRALNEARKAAECGEVPVGAVVTDGAGAVLATASNAVEARHDATAHAELLALRAAAARRGEKYLVDCTLTVTLEPCPLCAAAIALFRIKRLVFGAYDPKSGGVEHGPRVFDHATCHHRPEVIGGVDERESAAILRDFFENRRDPANSAGR
ncbi:nucleoside deaminase [Acidiphilium sp. AL]|uniref:tRNA-specific adenosine deaminase n=1 Tax=Acidiphilium iwatense TaxID=768198 RepID=A0ABS9E0Q6_9PROT|nr:MULTISPECIES: nucleoside deaminase [Acidiphilium]MCF3947501.1 nucleoside deaminase [Acidiphilium iwatense]MCU4158554.1 nucleoside deaminase [Acidiphilium sp. AL]